MHITKDRIGALCFLALCLGYGYMAGDIASLPGDEFEPISARTLPYALSLLGVVLSLCILFAPTAMQKNGAESRQSLKWRPVLSLLVLMVVYSVALTWLGFIIGTIMFLAGGFWIMGERRLKVLLGVAVPFVLVFWYGLTQLLGIYLEPGRIFGLFGG